VTQEHVREETPGFIKKDEWFPQCPDLNNPMTMSCGIHFLSRFMPAGQRHLLSMNIRTKSRREVGRNISISRNSEIAKCPTRYIHYDEMNN
jgi:hypothetical protein